MNTKNIKAIPAPTITSKMVPILSGSPAWVPVKHIVESTTIEAIHASARMSNDRGSRKEQVDYDNTECKQETVWKQGLA